MDQKEHHHLEEEKPLFTLSIASQLSGIPSHSIRQYIDRGLILPFKLDSKRHLFSTGDISRLKNINILIREHGLNFAGIRAMMGMVPCFRLKECRKEDMEECSALQSVIHPCWEASEKGRVCRNEDCRHCIVYRRMDEPFSPKSILV